MKRILAAAALMMAVSPLAFGQTPQSQPGQPAPAEQQGGSAADQELRRVLQEYDEALVKQDAAALERLLADDYTLTDPSGKVVPKAELVASAKSGDTKYEVGKAEDERMRVYGVVAVVTGRWTEKGTHQGKPFSGTHRFTTVLLKRGGRWQVLTDQVTPIIQEKP